VIVMNGGRSEFQTSDVPLGISRYYQLFKQGKRRSIGNGQVDLKQVVLFSQGRRSAESDDLVIAYGDELGFEITLDFRKKIERPVLSLVFYDKENRSFAEVVNFPEPGDEEEASGPILFTARLPFTAFSQGRFSISIDINAYNKGKKVHVARFHSCAFFDAQSSLYSWSPVQLNAEWSRSPAEY